MYLKLREAIRTCLDAGLEVRNRRNGFLRKNGGRYVHQTGFRSTDSYDDYLEAAEAFLEEGKDEYEGFPTTAEAPDVDWNEFE